MASSNFLTEARNFPSLTLTHHCCHFKCYFLIILQKKNEGKNTKMVVELAIGEKDTSKMPNSKDHNELKMRKNFIHLFREVFQFFNFLISSLYILLMLLRPEKILPKSLYSSAKSWDFCEMYWWRVRAEEFLSFSQWMSIKFPGQQPMLRRREIAETNERKNFSSFCVWMEKQERKRRRWAGGIKSRLTASRK